MSNLQFVNHHEQLHYDLCALLSEHFSAFTVKQTLVAGLLTCISHLKQLLPQEHFAEVRHLANKPAQSCF